MTLLVRSLLAFLALPGVVAFAAPALIAWFGARPREAWLAGSVLFIIGLVLLLWCVQAFLVAGRGTLAPWDPPRHLVRVGPYRWSRNPMYVAVACLLLAWWATFGSSGLAVYAVAVVVAFELRVVWGEEPWLERTHGAEWRAYKASVRRWI
jgi:protein-S-isoprenylcysteine O-methyltransferase Ste14